MPRFGRTRRKEALTFKRRSLNLLTSAATELKFLCRERLGKAAAGEGRAIAADSLIAASLAGELAAAALVEDRRHRCQSGEERIPETISHKLASARVAMLVGFVHGAKQYASLAYPGTRRIARLTEASLPSG
jgi:hypothetical protein